MKRDGSVPKEPETASEDHYTPSEVLRNIMACGAKLPLGNSKNTFDKSEQQLKASHNGLLANDIMS